MGGEVSLDTKALLTGTVTVKKCNHTGEGVCEYTPNESAETHAMTCLACGYAGAAEDCQYTYTPDSGGEHHITACQFCGRTKTEAHSYGSWTPQYSATAVTIQRICESCKYTKTDGTFTVPAPAKPCNMESPSHLPVPPPCRMQPSNGFLRVLMICLPSRSPQEPALHRRRHLQ